MSPDGNPSAVNRSLPGSSTNTTPLLELQGGPRALGRCRAPCDGAGACSALPRSGCMSARVGPEQC